MTRPDILRQARTAYVVSWARFQKLYGQQPRALFCFFEGEDAKYYGVRIDVVVRTTVRYNLLCGGKEGVLSIRSLIVGEPRYATAWAAYFVDADFDDNTALTASDIYVTPCYSIENLYVLESAFTRLVRDEIMTERADAVEADVATLSELYRRGLTSFLDAVSALNAWIQYLRRGGATSSVLRLKDVNLDDLVSISPSGSRALYQLVDLPSRFGLSIAVDEAEVAKVGGAFPAGVARALVFRGKYLLVFYERFVRHLLEAVRSKPPAYVTSSCTPKLTIQTGGVLSQLSQYAETPDCLLSFLDRLAARGQSC